MEPKSGLEIAFSPEFLTIMPIAVIIDIIGIVLLIFGLDDFGITDIIGWAILGTWGFLRSQVVPESTTAQTPSMGAKQELAKDFRAATQKTEKAAQEAVKAQKMSKSAKWAKRMRWLEFIPYVGALPLWSVSVYMTIKYS